MGIIRRPFRSFNGTDWDKHYFENEAAQVKFTKEDGTESDVQTELTELNDNLAKCDLLITKASKTSVTVAISGKISNYKFILIELMYANRSLSTVLLPKSVFTNGYVHNASAVDTAGTRLAVSCNYTNDTQVKITTSSDDVYCRLYGIL